MNVPYNLYYNIVEDSIYNLDVDYNALNESGKQTGNSYTHKMVLRRSGNKGKDIGGKLVLLDTCLRLNEDTGLIIFLHDKQSPYKVQNQQWRDKLFRIVEPGFVEKAIGYFNHNPQTGILAGTESIRNEYDSSQDNFVSNNKEQLARLRSQYAIKIKDHRYVAGTMFWVRAKPIMAFFSQYAPLEIRKELEQGNVMDEIHGTNTHAWERMLSWLIMEQGYLMKGL